MLIAMLQDGAAVAGLVVLPSTWTLLINAIASPLVAQITVKAESADNRLRWLMAGLTTIIIAVIDQVTAAGGFTLNGLATTALYGGVMFFFGQDALKHFGLENVLPDAGMAGRGHAFKDEG